MPQAIAEATNTAPKSRAREVRQAGMDPNFWYPAAFSRDISPGKTLETRFWGQEIALYRRQDGQVAALENRCPHRQIKLSHGTVEGCNLVCIYHGWTFDPEGTLVGTKHDDFGKRLPKVSITAYPVRERYGLIWFFPGDVDLAEMTPLPEIPHGDGPNAWASLSFSFTWKAHHSMVIDNLCNLTHLWVHGKWVPYDKTVLADSSAEGDRLTLTWRHSLRPRVTPLTRWWFREKPRSNFSETFMVYDYPYQSATSNNRIRSCNFMLPLDEDNTQVFSIQYWKGLPIPGLQNLPERFSKLGMPFIKPLTKEIFRQDGFTVEEEHASFKVHSDKPIPEPNPMVKKFNELAVRKWREYNERKQFTRLRSPTRKNPKTTPNKTGPQRTKYL